jgi:hypothetical protein
MASVRTCNVGTTLLQLQVLVVTTLACGRRRRYVIQISDALPFEFRGCRTKSVESVEIHFSRYGFAFRLVLQLIPKVMLVLVQKLKVRSV